MNPSEDHFRTGARQYGFARLLLDEIDRGQAVVLILLILSAAATEGIGLLLLVPMIGLLEAAKPDSYPISEQIVASGIPLTLGMMLALFVLLVFVRAIIVHVRVLAELRFRSRIVDRLRARAIAALVHCDWRELATMRQSDNASLLLASIDRVGFGVGQALTALATAATLAGVIAAGFLISPWIAIGYVFASLVVFLVYRVMRRRAASLGDQLDGAFSRVYGRLQGALASLRVIKSFGREDYTVADVTGIFQSLRRAEMAFVRDIGLGRIVLQTSGAIALALLIWLAMGQHGAALAAILPMVVLVARVIPLLGSLQETWQNWAHCLPAIKSAAELIDRAEAGRESEAFHGEVPVFNKEITLSGVTVRFEGRDQAALDGVELVVTKNEVLAIVGRSGSGKSTLADILGGMIFPDQGTMCIDGSGLTSGQRRAWRSSVAYVQQDPQLFTGTIRDNLRWAAPEASDDELTKTLETAHVYLGTDNTARLLDTDVGESGQLLSGGERQRVVLARALLRRPALLILDEATSALDHESERAISGALAHLKGMLTIVLICHRGELLDLADRIVALEDGRIVTVTATAPKTAW